MDIRSHDKSWEMETSKSNRSLKSNDKLFKFGDSGRVYSEKCIINQKNYLLFQMNKSKDLLIGEKPLLNKPTNRSLDYIPPSKKPLISSQNNFPYSPSSKFDNLEKTVQSRYHNQSSNK